MAKSGKSDNPSDGLRRELLRAEGSVGTRVVERSVSKRSAAATEEVHRIIEATFDVIAEDQSPELSLREVLRRVQLSTATFYRHFRSRDELLLAVLDEGSLILTGYLEHRMANETEPVARIVTWVDGFLHQAEVPTAADRTRPFAVGSTRVEAAFPVEHRRLSSRLVQPLEAEIVAGNELGHCESADPARDALAILDYTRASMLRHLLARSVPTEETMAYLTDLTLRVIGASQDKWAAPNDRSAKPKAKGIPKVAPHRH